MPVTAPALKARSSPDWCSGAWWAALPPVALVQPWGLPPTEAVRAIALALEGLNASWTPPLRVAAVEATARHLAAEKVPFRREPRAVTIAPEDACGVAVVFTA